MASSHRQIIRSTAVIGLASLSTIAIGLVRTKAAALLVGPVGIGLIGLYLNLVSAASALAGLGLNASAVREIAGAEADADRADQQRRDLGADEADGDSRQRRKADDRGRADDLPVRRGH